MDVNLYVTKYEDLRDFTMEKQNRKIGLQKINDNNSKIILTLKRNVSTCTRTCTILFFFLNREGCESKYKN